MTRAFFYVIMVLQKSIKEKQMTPKELANKTNVSLARVYQLAKKFNRLPTVEEILEKKGKVGRPAKYKYENDSNK